MSEIGYCKMPWHSETITQKEKIASQACYDIKYLQRWLENEVPPAVPKMNLSFGPLLISFVDCGHLIPLTDNVLGHQSLESVNYVILIERNVKNFT